MRYEIKVLSTLFVLSLLFMITAYAVIRFPLPSHGNIKSPANIVASPNSISWGQFNFNSSFSQFKNQTVILSNNGGTETTITSFDLANFVNIVTSDIDVTSNVIGKTILGNGGQITVWFQLELKPYTTKVGTFAFDIVLTGV